MFTNNYDLKYETPSKGPFEIIQYCTNVMVTLQYGVEKIRYNIHCIKPYTYDKIIEDIIDKNNVEQCQHLTY